VACAADARCPSRGSAISRGGGDRIGIHGTPSHWRVLGCCCGHRLSYRRTAPMGAGAQEETVTRNSGVASVGRKSERLAVAPDRTTEGRLRLAHGEADELERGPRAKQLPAHTATALGERTSEQPTGDASGLTRRLSGAEKRELDGPVATFAAVGCRSARSHHLRTHLRHRRTKPHLHLRRRCEPRQLHQDHQRINRYRDNHHVLPHYGSDGCCCRWPSRLPGVGEGRRGTLKESGRGSRRLRWPRPCGRPGRRQ
jgi:hypothetical protein